MLARVYIHLLPTTPNLLRLMADLDLWCFFEGKNKPFVVTIPRHKYVSHLQQETSNQGHNSACKDVDPKDLVLLKVCQNILFLFQPAFYDFF